MVQSSDQALYIEGHEPTNVEAPVSLIHDIPKGTAHRTMDASIKTHHVQGYALSRQEGSEDLPLKGAGSSGGLTVLLYHRAHHGYDS